MLRNYKELNNMSDSLKVKLDGIGESIKELKEEYNKILIVYFTKKCELCEKIYKKRNCNKISRRK